MNKTLAIRYIIYRVAQEFNIYHGKEANNAIFFNDNNNFTLEKCLLLPYIITIANGNKNFFLNDIFKDSFIPHFDNNDKKVLIGNVDGNDFKIYTAEDLSLEFNTNKLVFTFKDADFDFSEEADKELKATLHYNINYSIKFFIERRYKDFAILTEEVLKKITFQNNAFDVVDSLFRPLEINKNILANYFTAIAVESFYFTYYNEKIEEDVDMPI